MTEIMSCGHAANATTADGMPATAPAREAKLHGKVCETFTPRGDPGHDRFYCGCRGWD